MYIHIYICSDIDGRNKYFVMFLKRDNNLKKKKIFTQ